MPGPSRKPRRLKASVPHRIWAVISEHDIARYLSQYLAAQSVEAMRPDFPRWIGRLQQYGVENVPLALGSESARYIDLFALQKSKEQGAQRMAHDVRDSLPEIRAYKGR